MLPPLQDPNETPRHFSATTAKVRRDNRSLSRSSKEVHSSIKQTIRFILTLGARYNTGLRTCPTGDELCFYTLRNIREITSMHSKE
ncbi:hypothetical protein TNCV_1950291 [Trichonephila clavipes]|nr:hypothetical protein TNCV_1950291 [Trichonephila clavipes]